LCDVGRVAVKNCFKLLSFFTFIFAVLLQFPDSIKFISGYIPSCLASAIAYKAATIMAM